MAKGDSGLGSCVIVVGDPGEETVRTIVQQARADGIDTVPCGNVYSAVTRMAQMADRRLLVIGNLRELARHDRVFFRLAAARGVQCCCLLDQTAPGGSAPKYAAQPNQPRLDTRDLLAVLQTGVLLLADAQDVRGALQQWQRGSGSGAEEGSGRSPRAPDDGEAGISHARHPRRNAAGTTYEDLRATEAELHALLG